MKKAWAVMLLFALTFAFSACGKDQSNTAGSVDSSAVFVTINGIEYTQGEFDEYFSLFCAVNQLENSPENKEYFLASGLRDEFVYQQLILQEAEKENVTVSLDDASKRMAEDINNYYGSVDNYKKQFLEPIGITWDELVKFYRVGLVYDNLIDQRFNKTDAELEAIYDEQPENYQVPEQVAARHILVETEEEARDLIKQLDDGADFAALAEEYSIDSASAVSGGYLGYFTADAMVAEFSNEAFALPVGSYSHTPVQSKFGYHIVYVEDHTKPRQLTFTEAKDYIIQDVKYEIENSLYNDLFAEAEIVYPE